MVIRLFRVSLVFLIVIISFHFFEAKILNKFFLVYIPFLFVAFAIGLSMPYFFTHRQGFVLPVQLIVASMLVSIFIANMSWGQGFTNSVIGTMPMLLWGFFFFLLQKEIPVPLIEKTILIYGIIYCGLFFFQLMNSQNVMFGSGDEFQEERGTIRISIAGQGGLFLASFMALNKFTTQKKYRFAWFSLALLGLLIPVIQATRQLIMGVLIIFLYHFIKDLPIFRKVVAVTIFIGLLVLYIRISDNAIVKGLIETQEETAMDMSNNVRVLSGTYFLTELSPGIINRILGNGVPSGDNSSYSRLVDSMREYGFYMSDVGIISFYAMFGIIAVLGYILIWIKSFTLPLPEEYYYLKYYLWFLLITCLTSDSVYSFNFMICTVFVIYLYQIQYQKQKLIINPLPSAN